MVSFNVPYPADYGGVIDVYYRLQALHRAGVEIDLHCFFYGRGEAPILEKWCRKVYYYRRKTGLLHSIGLRPYIVTSRDSKQLLADLQKDDAPVLLEGLHCCAMLEHLDGSRVMVRAHNVEHDYYAMSADAESRPLKRLYLRLEALRLKRYEHVLLKAHAVFAVTENDVNHFLSLGCKNVVLMPTSHIDSEVVSTPSPEDTKNRYVLYHADLSVAENIQAVRYIASSVIPYINAPFVVAGRNPSPSVKHSLQGLQNVSLVANPDQHTMHNLIANAHVLFLVTNQPTGIKLKLLNSLYAGRHCLVNSPMVAGTRLGSVCSGADTPHEQIQALERLLSEPFTEQEICRRRQFLGSLYSNDSNAQLVISLASRLS